MAESRRLNGPVARMQFPVEIVPLRSLATLQILDQRLPVGFVAFRRRGSAQFDEGWHQVPERPGLVVDAAGRARCPATRRMRPAAGRLHTCLACNPADRCWPDRTAFRSPTPELKDEPLSPEKTISVFSAMPSSRRVSTNSPISESTRVTCAA